MTYGKPLEKIKVKNQSVEQTVAGKKAADKKPADKKPADKKADKK